jgi:hypothetical protein
MSNHFLSGEVPNKAIVNDGDLDPTILINIEGILIKPKNQMVGSGSHLNDAIRDNAQPTQPKIDDDDSKLEFNRAW